MLERAERVVKALISGQQLQCPNLARLAAAGRLVVIVLDKSQAPITLFQRSVARHLEGIPKDLDGIRLEMSGLTEQVKNLAAAVKDKLTV